MGNRAVITASRSTAVNVSNDLGIYLHWYGSRDTVQAFLDYCNLRGFRPPESDNYGWARLCQVIANYIGGDLSIGIDTCKNLDCNNGDNGTYIIKDWKIVGQKYCPYISGGASTISRADMLREINFAQPEKDRISENAIRKWCHREQEVPA